MHFLNLNLLLIMPINFQNFREHLCDYEGDVLENLEHIGDIELCQLACSHHGECRFFRYDLEYQDCELLNSDARNCAMVRGTPEPDFHQCGIDGFINWP